jgi:hypothetical protein
MERGEEKLIRIIKAWYPLFEIDKEAYMMLPDEIIMDVKELARKHNVKIQVLKMRRRTNYTFVAWIPQNKTEDEEDDEGEDIEIVEKEDYDTIKQMVYEFVKEKKTCKVDDIKKFFSKKGVSVGEDKIREILRQLHAEKKV